MFDVWKICEKSLSLITLKQLLGAFFGILLGLILWVVPHMLQPLFSPWVQLGFIMVKVGVWCGILYALGFAIMHQSPPQEGPMVHHTHQITENALFLAILHTFIGILWMGGWIALGGLFWVRWIPFIGPWIAHIFAFLPFVYLFFWLVTVLFTLVACTVVVPYLLFNHSGWEEAMQECLGFSYRNFWGLLYGFMCGIFPFLLTLCLITITDFLLTNAMEDVGSYHTTIREAFLILPYAALLAAPVVWFFFVARETVHTLLAIEYAMVDIDS